jgi:hypothetical protein
VLFGLLPRQTSPIVSDLISRTLWGPTSSIVGNLLRCERNYLWCPSGETRQTIKSLSFLFVLFFLLDFRWGFLFCWWSCLVIGGVVSQFHLEAKGKLFMIGLDWSPWLHRTQMDFCAVWIASNLSLVFLSVHFFLVCSKLGRADYHASMTVVVHGERRYFGWTIRMSTICLFPAHSSSATIST